MDAEFIVALDDLTEADGDNVIIHRGGWVFPEYYMRSQLRVKDSPPKPDNGFWCVDCDGDGYLMVPADADFLLFPEGTRSNSTFFVGGEIDDMYLAVDYRTKRGGKVKLCLVGYGDPECDSKSWKEAEVDELVPSDQDSEVFLHGQLFKLVEGKWVAVDMHSFDHE